MTNEIIFSSDSKPQDPFELAKRLKSMNKELLVEKTRRLAEEERRITVELLWHLREIERRRIPEELGMGGIFDYCVQVLKYSRGSAYRRVQAMRALHSIPDLEEKLKDGTLTVTTAATLQTFLQKARRGGISIPGVGLPNIPSRSNQTDRRTAEEKAKVADFFRSFEGLSGRDVDSKLATISPVLTTQERHRPLSTGDVEVKLTVSNHTFSQWNRIRAIAAHRIGFESSTRKVVELATDVALGSLEKEKGIRSSGKIAPAKNHSESDSVPKKTIQSDSVFAQVRNSNPSTESRRVPVAVQRLIWSRDGGRCTYRTPSGIRCESRYGLEIDHILPWSHGGSSNTPANLRLLCHAHHRLLTEKFFGKKSEESLTKKV